MELEFKKPFWYKHDVDYIYNFDADIQEMMGENVQANITEEEDKIIITPTVNSELFRSAVSNGLRTIYYCSIAEFCEKCLILFKRNLPTRYTPNKYWEINEVIDPVISNHLQLGELIDLKPENILLEVFQGLIRQFNKYMIEHDAPERLLLDVETFNIDKIIKEYWEKEEVMP